MTLLTTPAPERGTYEITVTFRDAAGNAVTPNAGLKWALMDSGGNIINGRVDQAITPAASVVIRLSGADLAIGGSGTLRVLTVQGTYGAGQLPIVQEARFVIENLLGV